MNRYLIIFVIGGCLAPGARSQGQSPAQPAMQPQAQSVVHTKWKTWYLPITDTITASFGADSMAVTTSTGAALLNSTFKVANDVLTLKDFGGENMCADMAGMYHVRIMADTLILIMDQDPCDARGGTLMAKRWIRVAAPPSAAPVAPASKKKKRG